MSDYLVFYNVEYQFIITVFIITKANDLYFPIVYVNMIKFVNKECNYLNLVWYNNYRRDIQ